VFSELQHLKRKHPQHLEVQYPFWTWEKFCLFTLFSCLCLFILCCAIGSMPDFWFAYFQNKN